MEIKKIIDNIINKYEKEITAETLLNYKSNNALESETEETKLNIKNDFATLQSFIDELSNIDYLDKIFNEISTQIESIYINQNLNIDKWIKNSVDVGDNEMHKNLIHIKNAK